MQETVVKDLDELLDAYYQSQPFLGKLTTARKESVVQSVAYLKRMVTAKAPGANTLTLEQCMVIQDVFQTEDAAGFTEVLMDLFHGYLQSSNDDSGEIPPETIKSNFFAITQVSRLLRILEPEDRWGLKQLS